MPRKREAADIKFFFKELFIGGFFYLSKTGRSPDINDEKNYIFYA